MSKPTIFFSHSSADKLILRKLKEIFQYKTGNTIDIFLSSDGQSIPLGRNWIYRIQESLNDAKLMIVFLTPNSVKSNWVYFESGYAYSRNIKVIPVGFLGIDLNLIPPPLSLLQGFNINSEDGFNNLISIVNNEFDHKHELSFANDEFKAIVGLDPHLINAPFGKLSNFIEEITIILKYGEDFNDENNNLLNKVKEYLQGNNIEIRIGDAAIFLYGVTIYTSPKNSKEDIVIKIDPLLAKENFPIIFEVIKNFRNNELDGIQIKFEFQEIITRLTQINKITSRIYKTEIKFGLENDYIFRKLSFNLGNFMSYANNDITYGTVYINITSHEKNIILSDISDIFDLLFAKEILSINREQISG